MLKIINYELESNSDIKIAHFSDIHYSTFFSMKRLKEITSKLKEIKPNYICITGDLVDNISIPNKKEMSKLLKFLDDISVVAKVIISLGNHDTRQYKDLTDNHWYEKLDKKIIVLNNSSYEDENIYFYGLTVNDDYFHNEKKNVNVLVEALSNIKLSNSKYNTLLFHSPVNFDCREIEEKNKFDLVLVGHTILVLLPHIIISI